MAALKSRFLVLALVLVALAGASGTAYAQTFHPGVNASLSCVAAAVPAQSRAEGIAELLGDIVVQCSLSNASTGGFPPSINANVAVTLNVNVTNNIDFGLGSSVTDAVLIVNEVFGSPIAPTAASTLSGIVPNNPLPQYGTRTSVNTIQWSGVILPVPTVSGNPGTLVIRVSNMRGNVSGLGIPTGEGSFPSAQVIAFISVSSQTAIPVTNNVLNIGIPLLGLVTRFRGTDQADVTLPIVALQCLSQNVDSDNNIVLVTSPGVGGSFTIRLSEGYASAFKTLGAPTVTPAAAQVEDGFPTPPSGVNGGGATQGTRFLIRFFNVPNGVRIGTPHRITGTSSGGHTLTINKVAGTDANGAGTLNTTLAPATEVTITGGFGYAVYEVVDSNPFVVENVVVPVTVAYRANTANDLPAVGTLQASASFAPISTVTTANRDAPEPRFVDTGRNTSMYTISRCATNLLFPFVTNQSGFDSGIAISNTTRDDKGTTSQAGSCTLYYFGSTTGGGAAPPQQTSAVIPAGGQLVFTLSGGNSAQNVAATPGFQGYMMASCQFLFAHGFAFITDGFGGVPTIAEGYLALVVPWDGVAGSRVFQAGAALGESLGH